MCFIAIILTINIIILNPIIVITIFIIIIIDVQTANNYLKDINDK